MLLQKDGFQKRNMKLPAMSPPIKDPIPNQHNIIIITQQDPILPPLLPKWPTKYKPFIDDTHFQIKQKTEKTILQIINVLRTKILRIN